MKYTVVGVFESPLRANEAVHVLLKAGFVAERLPGIADDPGQTPHTVMQRLLEAIERRLREWADTALSPYAQALAAGQFVVKIYATDASEADAATRILEVASAASIKSLATEHEETGSHDASVNACRR